MTGGLHIKRKTVFIFIIILLIMLIMACSVKVNTDIVNSEAVIKTVGIRKNTQDSGAWWGENITKMATSDGKAFTFVMDGDSFPRKVYLYRKEAGREWEEGESFHFPRPPNVLIDSKGYVHVIGYEPYDSENEGDGRIVHIRFDDAFSVSGGYEKTYLTEDCRSKGYTIENYGSYFCGAAIGSDDTMLAAYMNSVNPDGNGIESIGVRIYNPDENKWTYETVSDTLKSRYCYPFAFVSGNYYHVYAVEDQYDEEFGELSARHAKYRYRYGAVKHFQRPISGGEWQEDTLVDFNNTPGISKKNIADMQLRIIDFHVDTEGMIHAILRYSENMKRKYFNKGDCFHYTRHEDESTWAFERICPDTKVNWVKLWENEQGELFYICSDWSRNLWITPASINENALITKIDGSFGDDPTPFINSRRSGSEAGNDLITVLYSGRRVLEAMTVEVIID